MSLRFAILGLLSARPMTGYDVVQMFDDSVGFIWHAGHTQIYPEMQRMAREGLLATEDVPRGQKAVKTLYRMTDTGHEAFVALAGRVAEPPREKDATRLQASYFEFAPPGRAREQLRTHVAHYEAWLAIWRRIVADLGERRFPLLRTRLDQLGEREQRTTIAFKIYAYEGLIARAEMEIAWARRGLDLLDELALDEPTG